MLTKIRTLGLIAGITLFIGALVPVTASAQLFDNAKNQACGTLNDTNPTGEVSAGCGSGNGERVDKIIANVLNILSFVIGVIAVIMIVIGGFKYVMSQGDSNSISSAKNTLLFALVGLVIVASAQIIVKFVLGSTSTSPPTSSLQQLKKMS